ncbi:hypothetical protein [Arthrobacter sp. UYCu712]|uniref:hypothetical protein n=1 Tax=Arthrobacter sp. UYCu712 TaxID=3156340 RepID=UPI00339AECDF
MAMEQVRRGHLFWPRRILVLRHIAIAAALATAVALAGCTAMRTSPNGQYVPQTRTYCIGADEVDWNYAPSGTNQITGAPLDEAAAVFTQQGPSGSAPPT